MEIYSHRKIIDGFDDDLYTITQEFSRIPALRLENFFQYWKDKHMDCIFANKFDPRELCETIFEMNKKLVEMISDNCKNDLKSATLALYMLLCISEKQPSMLRQKIRLTCSDAINIQKLCEDVERTLNHCDATFAWNRLRESDSIDFVEERLIYGPSMLNSRRMNREGFTLQSEKFVPINQIQQNFSEFIEQKIEPSILELSNLSGNYEQVRNALKLDEVDDSTVDIVSKGSVAEFINEAKSLLDDFKNKKSL